MKGPSLGCQWAQTSLVVNHSQKFLPCCRFTSDLKMPLAHELSLQKAFEHPSLVDIRQKLQSGVFPPGCHVCQNEEMAGIKSLRQKKRFEESPSEELRELELFLGSHCNMMCRMCGPESSSVWAQHLGQKLNKALSPEVLLKDLDLRQIRHLKLLGGETLIQKEFLKTLDLFLMRGSPQSTTIYFVSNGSVGPETKFLEKLSAFARVDIDFSVDGIGPTGEYIRPGVDWSIIQQNIEQWQKSCRDFPETFFFRVHSTLQACNYADLLNIILFCKDRGLNWSQRLLDWPQALALENLPLKARHFLLQNMKENPRYEEAREFLKEQKLLDVWTFLMENFLTDNYVDVAGLLTELEKYDAPLKTNWKTSLPALAHALNELK